MAKSHPRREEVQRPSGQPEPRINKSREGEITGAGGQAAPAGPPDPDGRARNGGTNGGHITKTEQRALNQQETRSAAKSATDPPTRYARSADWPAEAAWRAKAGEGGRLEELDVGGRLFALCELAAAISFRSIRSGCDLLLGVVKGCVGRIETAHGRVGGYRSACSRC